MKWSLFAVLMFFGVLVSACSESVSAKGVIGNYDIMISQSGKTDAAVMTILTGSKGALLITFNAGITTDADGPNADGLRASLGSGQKITIAKQPAHIDHSTGQLNGTIFGDGKVLGDMIMMELHYLPTNFAITQTEDPDGGVVLSRNDMGLSMTLDYAVTGTKEM
jgi:hypothetical protein